MARRRQHTINTQTWQPAINNINQMERAMVNVMVRTELTHDDALDCVIPPEPLKLLRDAFPHFSGSAGDSSKTIEVGPDKVNLWFDFIAMKVVPPKMSLVSVQHTAPKINQFNAMMDKLLGICSQHEKLRRILRLFEVNNVTVGAARHYWPTLQSLLPSDHAFFQVKGDRFKDVVLAHDTVELLREAPEIVAKGLLCDPKTNGGYKKGTPLIRAMVNGQLHYLFMGPQK